MAQKTLRERFEEKVDRGGGPEACHEWTAWKDSQGYGYIWDGEKRSAAHRVSYKLYGGRGTIGDLHVLHSCDNPSCVNPRHLWLGTNRDNIDDKMEKGRWGGGGPCGERHGRAKLTEEQVKNIRSLSGSRSQREIGDMFGVTQSAVSAIMRGRNWSFVA